MFGVVTVKLVHVLCCDGGTCTFLCCDCGTCTYFVL